MSSATAFSSRKRGIGTFEFCDNFGGGEFGSLYSVKIYSGGWLSGRKFPSFGGVPVRAGWFFRIQYFLELGYRLVICSFLFFSWSEFLLRFWSVGEPPRPLRGHPSGGGELGLLSSATAFSSRKRGIGTFEFCDCI